MSWYHQFVCLSRHRNRVLLQTIACPRTTTYSHTDKNYSKSNTNINLIYNLPNFTVHIELDEKWTHQLATYLEQTQDLVVDAAPPLELPLSS